ncbi:hypothetical protein BGZ68_004573, partial [Mortierella alpina]
ALEEAAKKRLKTQGNEKDKDNKNGEDQGREHQNEAQEQENDGGDATEEEKDETGTHGDHGAFFGSLLAYLRSPDQTVRCSNRHIDLIKPIRSQYLEANLLHESDFLILGKGLEHSIVQTLAVSLAVQ